MVLAKDVLGYKSLFVMMAMVIVMRIVRRHRSCMSMYCCFVAH